jgi:CBS domain-containing protein
MSITEFCNRNVVCAARDTTIVEAARLMRENHIGDLLVVESLREQRKPIGIVTDRDIVLEVVAAGLDPQQLKLGDLVVGPLVTVPETAGYAETVRLMSTNGVRRIPVVDAAGDLTGIITLDDMLRQLAGPLAQLGELTNRGRQHEKQTRM